MVKRCRRGEGPAGVQGTLHRRGMMVIFSQLVLRFSRFEKGTLRFTVGSNAIVERTIPSEEHSGYVLFRPEHTLEHRPWDVGARERASRSYGI